MKRLIGVRRGRQTFGRGTLTFLYPRNRKILAYLREFEGETILCVYNLSRNAQACDLELAVLPRPGAGRAPGSHRLSADHRSLLPPDPARLRLLLAGAGRVGRARRLAPAHARAPARVHHDRRSTAAGAPSARAAAAATSPGRCCRNTCPSRAGSRTRRSRRSGWRGRARSRGREGTYLLAELAVEPDGTMPAVLLPAVRRRLGRGEPGAGRRRSALHAGTHPSRPQVGALYDATHADDFALTLLRCDPPGKLARHRRLRSCAATAATIARSSSSTADAPVRRIGAEQSNSLVVVGERRAAQGLSPPRSGTAPGDRARPLPHRRRPVRAHARACWARSSMRRPDGVPTVYRCRVRVRLQPRRRLAVHARSPRPGARADPPRVRGQPASGRRSCTSSISPSPG